MLYIGNSIFIITKRYKIKKVHLWNYEGVTTCHNILIGKVCPLINSLFSTNNDSSTENSFP